MENITTITDKYHKLQDKFPFLTCLRWQDREYIGIVQNVTDKMITFYNIDLIKHEVDRDVFIEYGASWWNESNRLLPISIFLRDQMRQYRPALQTFKLKETEILFGPVTSLNHLLNKRIKRRQIQLVIKKS